MPPRSARPVLAPPAQNLPPAHTSSSAEKRWHEPGPAEGQDSVPGALLVGRGGTERSPRHCGTAFPVAHPRSPESGEPARLPLGLLLILAVCERHALVLPTKADGARLLSVRSEHGTSE